MLLHLLIHYPPGALQPDFIEGPFQPHGKGGNLLIVALCHFVKFCIRTLNDVAVPKITINFCRIWATLVVGPMYLAISPTAPFNDHTNFPRPLIPDSDLSHTVPHDTIA